MTGTQALQFKEYAYMYFYVKFNKHYTTDGGETQNGRITERRLRTKPQMVVWT